MAVRKFVVHPRMSVGPLLDLTTLVVNEYDQHLGAPHPRDGSGRSLDGIQGPYREVAKYRVRQGAG